MAIGVAAALIVAAVAHRRAPAPAVAGPLTPDCDGALAELVIHTTVEAGDVSGPVYAAFLPQLPADVTVRVVCPDRGAFGALRDRLGETRCELSPLIVGHAISTWSRDRWLALQAGEAGGPLTLLTPRGEAGSADWPQRRGDARVAGELAARLGDAIAHRRSELYFDGGDFVADVRRVFVTPAVAHRNVQHTVADRAELESALERMLGRQVILFDDAPDHHAGMFCMPIGDNRILVGDPSLARPLLDGERAAQLLPGGGDFSDETQRTFDAVADACRQAGLDVLRIPTAASADGRTYLAYLNVILDDRPSGRVVYMPVYQGARELNRAAADVWRQAGWKVCEVDCTSAYRHGGSLRCLVNVLRRR